MSTPDVISTERSSGSIFRNRDFMLVWASGAMLWLTRATEWVVLALIVAEFTSSAFEIALVSAFYWLPMLPMSIFSGVISDRLERWGVLVFIHVVAIIVTIILMILILSDQILPWHIYIGALVLGTALSFDWTTRGALMHDIVGSKNVIRAMSMQSLSFGVGSLLGPVVGGYLLELAGRPGPYYFLLAIYILALLAMIIVRSRSRAEVVSSESPLAGVIAGLKYCIGNRFLLGLVACCFLTNFMATSAFALYPVIGKDYLHVGEGLVGLLFSVQGIGVIIGAVIIAAVGWFPFVGRVFVLACVIWLIMTIGVALSPWYPLTVIIMLVLGVALGAYFALQISLSLLAVDPNMRGRALSMTGVAVGMTTLGTFAVGAIADVIGTPMAIAINAGFGLCLFLPIIFLTPLARRPLTRASDSSSGADDK